MQCQHCCLQLLPLSRCAAGLCEASYAEASGITGTAVPCLLILGSFDHANRTGLPSAAGRSSAASAATKYRCSFSSRLCPCLGSQRELCHAGHPLVTNSSLLGVQYLYGSVLLLGVRRRAPQNSESCSNFDSHEVAEVLPEPQ